MKKYTKYTALALSALMLFGAAGCQKKPEEPAPVESTEESTVESTEEVTEVVEEAVIFDNLADASEAMGFEIPAPEAFGEYTLKSVAVYSDFADLYFAKAEAEEEPAIDEEAASEGEEVLEGAEETVEEVVEEDAPQAELTETEEAADLEGAVEDAAETVGEAAEEALEGAEMLIDTEVATPDELVIRITKSTEDVFADENEYGEDVVINDVTLKMMGEVAGAATWMDGEFTYYMYLAEANLANEDIAGIVDAFKAAMIPEEELAPIEEMPTEVAPEEVPVEEAPVEEAPAEEVPAEETTDAN